MCTENSILNQRVNEKTEDALIRNAIQESKYPLRKEGKFRKYRRIFVPSAMLEKIGIKAEEYDP
ncbi:MAG: hypothetical protein ACFFCW_31575, partial [Candidatus Hodarchaeota archaeon]